MVDDQAGIQRKCPVKLVRQQVPPRYFMAIEF